MSIKTYLVIMSVATLIVWLTFGFVIWTVNPLSTNWVGFMLFYSSLFVALIGTISIIGFLIRFTLLKRELIFQSVKEAFRQSFMLSFLVCASLFMLARDVFSWTNLILLAVGLTVLEFFLMGYKGTIKN
jgi:hypothetical protein